MSDENLLKFCDRRGAKGCTALCVMSGGRLPAALFMVFLLDSKGAKGCKSVRSRQELSNEYLLAKIGVDTAENEPLQVMGFNFQVMGFNFH